MTEYNCLPCREGRHFDCISKTFDNLENPCVCEHPKTIHHRYTKKKGVKA